MAVPNNSSVVVLCFFLIAVSFGKALSFSEELVTNAQQREHAFGGNEIDQDQDWENTTALLKRLEFLSEQCNEQVETSLSQQKTILETVEELKSQLKTSLETRSSQSCAQQQCQECQTQLGNSLNQQQRIEQKLEEVQKQMIEMAKILREMKQQGKDAHDSTTLLSDEIMSKLPKNSDVKLIFKIRSGRKFFIVNTPEYKAGSNFNAAQKWCIDHGMQIPMLKNVEDVTTVAKEIENRGFNWKAFWLSASDIGRSPGHFYWKDGTEVDSGMWSLGDPNEFGQGKETCVIASSVNHRLWDTSCTQNWNIVCEAPEGCTSAGLV